MKYNNEVEREYEGITDDHMKNQQLDVAIRALHVIAVMQNSKDNNITNIAIDALREMETYGYLYDHLALEYD
jgi:hypothetical protein|tara:strand:- start:5490 stop:5705 length:216 start_codon:yes stop_codon:yes gene_type:complete